MVIVWYKTFEHSKIYGLSNGNPDWNFDDNVNVLTSRSIAKILPKQCNVTSGVTTLADSLGHLTHNVVRAPKKRNRIWVDFKVELRPAKI